LLAVVILVLGFVDRVAPPPRDEEYQAMLVVGILATIVSQISWTHHLVWLVLAWFVLALGARRWDGITGVVLVLSAFYYSPPWAPVQDGPVWLAVPRARPLMAPLTIGSEDFDGQVMTPFDCRREVPSTHASAACRASGAGLDRFNLR
jgi:hypothetical protein